MTSFQLVIDYIAAIFSVLLIHRLLWTRSRRRFPPGPRGWPIIGNILDIPKEKVHIAYTEMGLKYNSDLIYLDVAGTSVLILNSSAVANDLCSGRSSIYSNRPPLPMVGDLMGWNYIIGFLPYGDRWRKSRALCMHQFTPSKMKTYQKPQIAEGIRLFLKSLLDSPQDFEDHIRFFSTRTILSTTYGIDIENSCDYFFKLVTRALTALSEALIPGIYLVDTFPSLKYVPQWFPGAAFKRKAAFERQFVERLRAETMEFVKNSMANGAAKSSMASREMQKMQDEGSWSEEKEEILKDVLATIFPAGTDTTTSVTATIFLALVRNPEILRKGQAAIDAVVGQSRLPDFGDEGQIPYITALVMEGLRWRPALPLGIAHQSTHADVYRGYYIPTDTIVVGNSWAILHDPAVYGDDVDQFRPERFLHSDGTLNSDIPYPEAAFGYGRRICAGKGIAQTSIWLAVASIVACFDITKAKNRDGVEIDPSTDYNDGFLSHPLPYECSIKPRSENVKNLIKQDVNYNLA